MPPKKKTTRTRWESKTPTAAALSKFEEEFEKSMGIAPYRKPKRPDVVSTGSMALDLALVIGGVPEGRVIETWGPEHAGKTTVAILMAIGYQKKYPKKRIAWVDMEQTFDFEWAEALGLDTSKKAMWFFTPQTAEDVADAVKRFVHSGLCSLVVLDSIGGMISRIEMEKEADEATVGKVPQIVTRMVKACAPAAAANGTTLHVINQVRANIGGYGADETTGGGWALKHVTTIKLQVKRAGGEGSSHALKLPGQDKPTPVGHKIAIKVQKNKMAPYGRQAEVWLHNVDTSVYGPVGVDFVHEVFSISKTLKLMGSGAGGNYEVAGVKIKGGEPKVMEHLRSNPDVVEALRVKILDTVSGQVTEETEPDEPDDDLGMDEILNETKTVQL